ncbi:MAG: Fic family protein [Betaproteobacteria bacterium]
MRPEEFICPEAGRLVRTPEGAWAFVPAPLPPRIQYDPDLVLALSQADAALSELSGLGRQLPNPHLLIAPYVRREAVLSSRIEGTRATLSDLYADEIADVGAARDDDTDAREVRNYVIALEHGIQRLKRLPLSLRLVREIHGRLMAGVRGARKQPGEFRRNQNFIGAPGSTLQTATYVPPPPIPMAECLGAWERFLHDRSMPELIQVALLHDQFEAIHPFLDGNGRVGRLLITLFLIERGRLSQPLLYLSAFIEAHRGDYYRHLQRTRTHCEWKPWLMYFLNGVRTMSAAGAAQARVLSDLREVYRARVAGARNALALIDPLFENPFLDAKRAARLLEKSDPTARKAISALVAAGIIRETSGREWGQRWVAEQLLRAIETPPEVTEAI